MQTVARKQDMIAAETDKRNGASAEKSHAYYQIAGDEENVAESVANDEIDEEESDASTRRRSLPTDSGKVSDKTLLHLMGINAFAFAYGLLIATFGLITLPLESERLWPQKHAFLLAIFLGLCGISQLSGPVAGYFSDRCVHPSGKRSPFLMYGSLIGIPSLYMLRWASEHKNLAVYLVFFLISMLALNVMYVAYSGALTDIVNENQRGTANGLMGAFTVLGASVGFGCFSYFLDLQSGYYFYIWVLTVAVAISLYAYDEVPLDPHMYQAWSGKEIGECYWVDRVGHRDFYLVFVSRTSAQTFMLFYFRDIIGSSDPQTDVSYLALCGQLAGAVVCVPMGMLSNRLGRKVLVYISSAIIIATYVMFMFCRTRNAALLAGALYGIGNGTYLSVDYALACDTLPSAENAARYLGIW
eukprot:CAMPEP_0113595930 /NCGR_PEP_ID=MMETSP0015_2-20120614/40033_1 /TAXON_ID=2838 /ORGANISM="Odontella" /LENGTH=413 /DNA_ID=CAMNT_0000503347 /DNA_START=86 /DNA_END=1324 /DNA_ORIENTATION=+ /assembly_acc=CAM_ASM_000160